MILSPLSVFIAYDKWDPGQRFALLIFIYSSALLSFFSTLFILYALSVLYKARSNSIRRLVYQLIWADLGSAILWLVAATFNPSSETEPLEGADSWTSLQFAGVDWGCRLVAPLQIYFCMTSIFWVTNIGTCSLVVSSLVSHLVTRNSNRDSVAHGARHFHSYGGDQAYASSSRVVRSLLGLLLSLSAPSVVPTESSPYTCFYHTFAWALPILVILPPLKYVSAHYSPVDGVALSSLAIRNERSSTSTLFGRTVFSCVADDVLSFLTAVAQNLGG